MDENEQNFIEGKSEDKTYGSKRFLYKDYSSGEQKRGRYVSKVFSMKEYVEYVRNKDKVLLYKTPTQKQEVLAHLNEDTKEAYFTLQRFTTGTDSPHKIQFTFGLKQLEIINKFVSSLPYINYENSEKFSISDVELGERINKISRLEKAFEELSQDDLKLILNSPKLQGRDFVNLAYRNNGLKTFEQLLYKPDYFEVVKKEKNIQKDEVLWQLFFQKHPWIFGHGLDYRFMTIFDREMSVGDGGTQDRGKPKIDFLSQFSDFTVLIEIKTPQAQLFKGNTNRTGAWLLHNDLLDAFSQALEQKAEWSIKGDRSGHLSNDGERKLQTRTRDPKIILLIGNKKEQILSISNIEEKEIKQDTFELFRRDSRNVEILTFDELYERAYYIVHKEQEL